MCGICGIIHVDRSRPVSRQVLSAMNRTMFYRGPDDEGYYVGNGSGLAMRRLSIIDVSGGHQPFLSEDGNVVCVCNGELYNFKDIRHSLKAKGHVFHSGSDSEILPHLYEEDGVNFLPKINGMFGMAVWDEKERTLFLARDRMGKKPLYFANQNGVFVFASEVKALLAHPELSFDVNRDSVSKYLAYEYVPSPNTIFEGIHRIEPGFCLVWKNGEITIKRYWDIPVGEELKGISEDEAAERFLSLFKDAVKKRLISDVPLGVFLSGGIDSSAVVAMMTKLVPPKNVKTFSIAFAEKSFDESSFARQVAAHFGTDHRERLLSPQSLVDLIPRVFSLQDEPNADASIVPTFALSQFTREHVTVALGGDGGDELFAGYPTFQADVASSWYRKLPLFLRRSLIEPLAARLPVSDDNISFDFKVKQFLKGAGVEDFSRHLLWLGAFSPDEQKSLLNYSPVNFMYSDVARHEEASEGSEHGNRLLYLYMKTYLTEDIMTKVDRASMWSSLEARAPLLDYEVVEFVARLPYKLKLSGFKMKYLLKKAIAPRLPENIIKRPKKGFGMPVAKWIKGPLKNYTTDLLAPEKIAREGFFKPKEVLRLLDEHIKGKADHRKKLWTLIVFEEWLGRYGSKETRK